MRLRERGVTEIDKEDIRSRLERKRKTGRKLIEIDFDRFDGRVEGRLFILEGTPPKGYALYIPAKYQLNIYDLTGERTRILEEVNLVSD
ncbi:hypothetical protein HBNXNv_0357 [Candidatus Nanohalovita haloferacivicina]|nr:hypothetical protein HBNXNv_0357 [Candidatus Nanohalobia archaeon BNXNv]